MFKKRNILSILALVVALASLTAAISAWTHIRDIEADYEAKLTQMEQIHAQLQQEIADAATTEPTVPAVPVNADLKSWDLNAVPWYDNCGAVVTLTAVPAAYKLGMTAAFLVRLDGQDAADIPCSWNGTAFTASAELTARNGYSYICVLNPDSENRSEITLASPENPVDTLAVNLADSIHSYCNLILGDWSVSDRSLVIASCRLQAQLPQLTPSGRPSSCQVTKLTLRQNGEVLRTHWVTLRPGEASNSYELSMENLTFLLPGLEEGDHLELWLEVTLSDGQILSAAGGGWDYADGRLQATAG